MSISRLATKIPFMPLALCLLWVIEPAEVLLLGNLFLVLLM